MLLFKLALVALSIFSASWVAKRFGHAVGGALAGMPVIAGPIMALVLIDHGPVLAHDIALATLVCVPATVAHIVTFTHMAKKMAWPLCLAQAMTVFFIVSLALVALDWPDWMRIMLAALAPAVGLMSMPRVKKQSGGIAIPALEIVARILAAITLAGTIIVGADYFPASISGILLAIPIAGSILPCFTLPTYGYQATVNLLGGFAKGLNGFCTFFIGLLLALPVFNAATAFLLALSAAFAVALLVYRINQRLARSSP
jgi:hypothetical protein